MAHNEALTNRVRESLTNVSNVEEKKMFGGIAFMVNGKMCVNVGDNELMLRIDPALHDELVEKKDCRTVIMKGREYKGYLSVAEERIKTKKEMDYWINLALSFNPKAKAAKKKR